MKALAAFVGNLGDAASRGRSDRGSMHADRSSASRWRPRVGGGTLLGWRADLARRGRLMAQGCRIGRCFQVGSYLGYTGRDADVVAKAAFDPSPTPTVHRSSRVTLICAGWREAILLPDYVARRQF